MTRYCEKCGCNVQEIVQVFPGHLRKECAECGSTGPFMAELPDRGVGRHVPGRHMRGKAAGTQRELRRNT